jgi:hypothetical protein
MQAVGGTRDVAVSAFRGNLLAPNCEILGRVTPANMCEFRHDVSPCYFIQFAFGLVVVFVNILLKLLPPWSFIYTSLVCGRCGRDVEGASPTPL